MAWAPNYITTDELKSYSRITHSDDDAELAFAISSASRAIDHHCGRQFGSVTPAVARYYSGVWDSDLCRWYVPIDDLMTTDNLVVKTDDGTDTFATTLTINTDFRPAPYNAAADGKPWTYLLAVRGVVFPTRPRGVEVTAEWGWDAVPAVVEQACLMQASRWFARRNAPFGIAGSPQDGSEMRLLAKLDPDVEKALSAVRRYWGAV